MAEGLSNINQELTEAQQASRKIGDHYLAAHEHIETVASYLAKALAAGYELKNALFHAKDHLNALTRDEMEGEIETDYLAMAQKVRKIVEDNLTIDGRYGEVAISDAAYLVGSVTDMQERMQTVGHTIKEIEGLQRGLQPLEGTVERFGTAVQWSADLTGNIAHHTAEAIAKATPQA